MDGTGLRPTDYSVRRSTLRVNERTAPHSGFRGVPRALDSQPERHVRRLHRLDHAHDGRGLVLRDRRVAVDDERRGLGVGQHAASVDHRTRPPSSIRSGRSGKLSFSASSTPAWVPRRRPSSAARRTSSRSCDAGWASLWLEAEPAGRQGEDVERCELRIEVRRAACRAGHDRVEHVLERADEAHREVVVAIERRQAVSQIAAIGGGRRDRAARPSRASARTTAKPSPE